MKRGKRDRSAIGNMSGKAGQVRYWQYGQAENSPDLAISDLSRFLFRSCHTLYAFRTRCVRDTDVNLDRIVGV